MKNRYLLAFTMAVIFTLSHMAPAFGDNIGFDCFRWCAGMLLDFAPSKIFGWLYYGGFAISNIAFIGFTIFSFTKRSFTGKSRVIIAILSLHVISWLLLNFGHSEGIHIGYYMWLSAYIIMLYVSTKYRKKTTEPNQSLQTTIMAVTDSAAQTPRQP